VDKSNLVVKAMDLMRKKSGINKHFKIHLDKVVPMQAGLGGGSGNAATAMYAFNALCGFPGYILILFITKKYSIIHRLNFLIVSLEDLKLLSHCHRYRRKKKLLFIFTNLSKS